MPLLEPLFPAIVASAVALLFGVALAHKLGDWPRFLEALSGYDLLPRPAASWIGPGVVLVEAGIVAGLLFAAGRTPALWLAALVLCVYAFAMAVNLVRGHALADCGCGGFGVPRQRLEWWMVRRNLLLTLLALLATLPAASRGLEPAEIFVVCCATAAAAGLYLAHGTLAANRRLVVG